MLNTINNNPLNIRKYHDQSDGDKANPPPLLIKKNMDTLPVVRNLVNRVSTNQKITDVFSKTAIVYVTHLLETSVNALDGLINMGILPKNIFVIGKHYSKSEEVIKKIKNLGVYYEPCSQQNTIGTFSQCFAHDMNSLWKNIDNKIGSDVKYLIVSDHGGYASSCIPNILLKKYPTACLETTTGGIINFESNGFPPTPLVNVAESAAKKILESPLIATSIVKSLNKVLPCNENKLNYGVIGYGSIGKAVSNRLTKDGNSLILYEKNKLLSKKLMMNSIGKVSIVDNVETLIRESDYIIGCTGRNIITSKSFIETLSNDKVFISCSSGDKEFLSILKILEGQCINRNIDYNPLDTVSYRTTKNGLIRVLRGGFPINFDSSGESVPAEDIQLTRALVLAGILQCSKILSSPESNRKNITYSLNSEFQQNIVNDWMEHRCQDSLNKELMNKFNDVHWISKNSRGIDW